jgi:SAM-dependent methyltransferase
VKPDAPSSADDYGSVASRWIGDGSQSLWRRHCDALYLDLLDRWRLGSGSRRALKTDLFDEAVGEGLVFQLARPAALPLGIDSSLAVTRAAANADESLRPSVADLRHLPFRDGSIDLVLSNSTLDHFESVREIEVSLRELARVVSRDGQLILTLDNPSNPLIRLRNRLPLSWLRRTGLVPYFVGATLGLRELETALQRVGFEVRRTGFLMHCPRVLAVPAAARLRDAPEATRLRFLRRLMRWEAMSSWPSARFSGHYVAVSAVRRSAG